jgi:ADP-ribosylglycohydrolase
VGACRHWDARGIIALRPFRSVLKIGAVTIATKHRIIACLKGVAVGDAIGKQTENLSYDDVLRWYPNGVRGFEGLPGTPIPRYMRNRKREWKIAETTDDTERTIAVARAILRDREVRHTSVGRELLECRKSVHRGVQSLWEFHQAGDPARVTDRHDGCGAAVRVAPVGILHGTGHLGDLVAAARQASISTHGGPLAVAAAAATAAAVSAAVDGLAPPEIIGIAQRAAAMSEGTSARTPINSFANAVSAVHQDLTQWRELRPGQIAARYFPDNPLTIVPLALALAAITHSAEAAILLAANVGGDSDSVASIAGGIAGARFPGTINPQWYAAVEEVNGHELTSIAEGLSALRR